MATVYGHAKVLEYLLHYSNEPLAPGAYGRTILHHAVSGSRYEIVSIILSHCRLNGITPDKPDLSIGRTPLHLAIRQADHPMVKLLLPYCGYVMHRDANNESPLDLALRLNYHEIADTLILSYQ